MGNSQTHTQPEKPQVNSIPKIVETQPTLQTTPQPKPIEKQPNKQIKTYCQWLREFDEIVETVESYHCLPIDLVMDNEWLKRHIIDDEKYPGYCFPDVPDFNPLKDNVFNTEERKKYINNICNKISD